MRRIITAIVIVLALFSAQPRPANAGGSDPLTIALSWFLSGLIIPTFEFCSAPGTLDTR